MRWLEKKKIKKYWARKLFIRFHMSLILVGTILVGLLASYVLFEIGIQRMTIRYPLTVLISYGGFFMFIRIWLSYIKETDSTAKRILESAGDVVSFPDVSLSSSSPENTITAGGGEFGGGGASGNFEIPDDDFLNESSGMLSDFSVDAAGDIAGEAVSSVFDEGAGILLVPLMVVLALVFGAATLLIYEAPLILTEAAFEFLLAGVLLKQAKVIDNPDWAGSVFKNTWKPFCFTLAIAFGVAFGLIKIFPGINKLTEII